jgi:catecholate siderophore receptor
MKKTILKRHVAGLLATTFIIAVDGLAGGAIAQTTLDTIDVRGNAGSGDTDGYLATRTSTATKTDTPLINVPQSVSVVTKEQIKDTNAQKMEDVVRYVPGVNWHQGENNRDQVVIRGQSSNADFFVNGMRDDAQIYRDLYNAERVEFLKGPNAMIFGRGGGGGVVNRVLKEADGQTIREVTVQGGMFGNGRVQTDVGGKINDQWAARLNAVFEDSDSFRDFVHLRRYGVNPTATWSPAADTRVKFSYEYFNDWRTADRGIPSLLLGNPSRVSHPYLQAPPEAFFGNPDISYTKAQSNIATNMIEHEFSKNFQVKSQTRFQDTQRFYQNVYPGSAVDPATSTYKMSAYNNQNNRQNLFNQTDWTLKFGTGPASHTLVAGTEFGKQVSNNSRHTGFFDNGTVLSDPIDAGQPTVLEPVKFTGLATDARNQTNLIVSSVYAQDQVELTRWLQLIGGIRFQRFDLDYVNRNEQNADFGMQFSRTDNLTSPRLGVVLKPVDNTSFYASWSRSYLPASGDQFGALTVVSTGLKPEQFANKEVGFKWDIMPALAFNAAYFQLDRENTPVLDSTGVVVAAGHSRVKGEEVSLVGRVTNKWQMTAGFAHLDARYVTNTANAGGTVVALAGNRVPFVPINTYSLWNKYDFTDMWAAGIGVLNETSYFANANNLVLVPGFTRVDGAIYWTMNKNLKAQVNVENILGAKYYSSADGNNNISPGSPRAVRFVMTANF